MEPSGACIQLDGLARSFDSLEAVRGLSLEVRRGELFGLLGPNGAGKTTTISLLATLIPPSGGDARILGHSLRENPVAIRRSVGLAPQEVSVYPRLSGERNLRFFGRLHGLRGGELVRSTDRALDLVGLRERGRDLAETYSGGMLRRLNLACSLVHRPAVLLLDEPTSGVDPQSREYLLRVIRDLAAGGTTIVYTTHYMEEAERLCDRIAIMDQGRIIAQGSLPDLLAIVGMGEVIDIHCGGLELDLLSEVPGLIKLEGFDLAEGERGSRLYVERAAQALGPLGALLADLGQEVSGIEVYPVNLERVFMHLTGRALRD